MTSSQWLDHGRSRRRVRRRHLGLAVRRARARCCRFVGVVLGAVAGVLLAPHVVSHIDGPRTKLFVTLFLILGAGRHRRDRGRGARPRGARRDPQPHAARSSTR